LFRFYCPSHTPRIVEVRNAKFLEDFEFSGNAFPRRIEFEEAQDSIELPSMISLRSNQPIKNKLILNQLLKFLKIQEKKKV